MQPLEKTITQTMIEHLAEEWSNHAGSVMDITVLGNEVIAKGCELGCYKLAYALREHDIKVHQDNTKSYWYLVKNNETKEELNLAEKLRQKLDYALNEGFVFEIHEKIELEKQLQNCLDIVSEF